MGVELHMYFTYTCINTTPTFSTHLCRQHSLCCVCGDVDMIYQLIPEDNKGILLAPCAATILENIGTNKSSSIHQAIEEWEGASCSIT